MAGSMYDFLISSFEGKYFQNLLNPTFIADFSEKPPVHLIRQGSKCLDAWFPLQQKHIAIPFDNFHLYKEISESLFEKIQEMYKKGLVDKIEKDHDIRLTKTNKHNKPNLSKQNSSDDLSKIPGVYRF